MPCSLSGAAPRPCWPEDPRVPPKCALFRGGGAGGLSDSRTGSTGGNRGQRRASTPLECSWPLRCSRSSSAAGSLGGAAPFPRRRWLRWRVCRSAEARGEPALRGTVEEEPVRKVDGQEEDGETQLMKGGELPHPRPDGSLAQTLTASTFPPRLLLPLLFPSHPPLLPGPDS